ncbi:MAG: hypothetical protein ABIB04_03415 [Patescibacteria group bacterium]
MSQSSLPPPPNTTVQAYSSIDPFVEKFGKVVFVTSVQNRDMIEVWVKKIAAVSGQKVDWHFLGPSVCILAVGDLHLVKLAIVKLIDEHDQIFLHEVQKDPVWRQLPKALLMIPRPDWWAEYANKKSDSKSPSGEPN